MKLFLSIAVDTRGGLYWFSEWNAGLEGSLGQVEAAELSFRTTASPGPSTTFTHRVIAHGMLGSIFGEKWHPKKEKEVLN